MITETRPTPVLEGEAAERILNKMAEPPSEKEKEYWKKVNQQRFVPFDSNDYIGMNTIQLSEENYTKLSKLRSNSETYNDVIKRLITFYEENYFEDFSDEDAKYYNERTRQFENGNYEGTKKVDLDAIRTKKN